MLLVAATKDDGLTIEVVDLCAGVDKYVVITTNIYFLTFTRSE